MVNIYMFKKSTIQMRNAEVKIIPVKYNFMLLSILLQSVIFKSITLYCGSIKQ